MLFPEPNVTEGQSTNSVPVFLSGEIKQAVYTSTLIPPKETVEWVNREVNPVQLQNYLYATSHLSNTMRLTSPSSQNSIGLNRDLDDSAVSLLIENGLGKRFSTACNTWKDQNTKNKEIFRGSVFEKKQHVDNQLKKDKPLLEGALAREIARRISDAYPYVLIFGFYLSKQSFNASIVYLIQKSSPLRLKA